MKKSYLVACTLTLIILGTTMSYIISRATAADSDPDVVGSVANDHTASMANVAKANDPQTWVSCTPVGIATYQDRVHVQCAAAISGISFFAVSASDPQYAARVLSVLSTAQAAGRTLTILYDPSDTSGASFGCQTTDCRKILAVGFGQ